MIRFVVKLAQESKGTRIEGTKATATHAQDVACTLAPGHYPATLARGQLVVHARNRSARYFNEDQNIFIDGWKGKIANGIITVFKRDRGLRTRNRSGSRTGRFHHGVTGSSAYHQALRESMIQAYSDAIWNGKRPARRRRSVVIVLPIDPDNAGTFRYWTGSGWTRMGILEASAKTFDSFRDARRYIRSAFAGIDVSNLWLDDTEGSGRIRPWRRKSK